MKAMAYYKYGGVENIVEKELPKPIPKDEEVLIKIYATSVNSWDWDLLQGKPIFSRLWGLFKPRINVLGSDVAGVVEAVGHAVTKFNIGDKVFGDLVENNWGGFAEYTCANEKLLTPIPQNLDFVEAAAFPQGACMAYQAVIESGIQKGDTVLVNGAGAGCGSFAVQFAKHLGAEVTGVDRADKFEFMKHIGVDHVVDYNSQNYTDLDKNYDVIIDMVMHHSLKSIEKRLGPSGRFRIVGGLTKRLFQVLVTGHRLSSKTGKDLSILAAKSNYKLSEIKTLIENGHVKPYIDTVYSLEQVPEAMQYIGDGNVKGKIVVQVVDEDE